MTHQESICSIGPALTLSEGAVTELPWAAIDTVLLDLDGTLLDLHFDNFFWLEYLPARYATHHRITEAVARQKLHADIQAYEGTLQWYCLDHWSRLLQMDVGALKAELRHKIAPRPHSLAFLNGLAAAKKRCLLVTNAHRAGLDIKLAVTQIAPYFSAIISSHDYQAPKESSEFWQQLQKAHAFDPARTLFIDDTPRILRQAAAQGVAYQVCVTRPDSQKPARTTDLEGLLSVADFDVLLPTLNHYIACSGVSSHA